MPRPNIRRSWGKFEEKFFKLEKSKREMIYFSACLFFLLCLGIAYSIIAWKFGWVKLLTPEEIEAQRLGELAKQARSQEALDTIEGIISAIFGFFILFFGWIFKHLHWFFFGWLGITLFESITALKDIRNSLQKIEWKLEELKPNATDEWSIQSAVSNAIKESADDIKSAVSEAIRENSD